MAMCVNITLDALKDRLVGKRVKHEKTGRVGVIRDLSGEADCMIDFHIETSGRIEVVPNVGWQEHPDEEAEANNEKFKTGTLTER